MKNDDVMLRRTKNPERSHDDDYFSFIIIFLRPFHHAFLPRQSNQYNFDAFMDFCSHSLSLTRSPPVIFIFYFVFVVAKSSSSSSSTAKVMEMWKCKKGGYRNTF
jgi:uncharacterized membrane protein